MPRPKENTMGRWRGGGGAGGVGVQGEVIHFRSAQGADGLTLKADMRNQTRSCFLHTQGLGEELYLMSIYHEPDIM